MIFRQRRLALCHLYRRDAQAPYVRLRVVSGLSDDFWCHPEWCADEGVSESAGELCCHTEIGKFDLPGCRKQDVCGLDVAMNGAFAMEVVEAKKELAHDDGNVAFGEDPRLQEVETGPTGEVLHDDPQLVCDHEGAIVPGHVLRVALRKTRDLLLNLRDVVVRVLEVWRRGSAPEHKEVRKKRTDLLDGYNLLGLIMDCLVDGAKASSAELLEEGVLARGIAAGYIWPRLGGLDPLLGRWGRRLGELFGLQTRARVRRAVRRMLFYEAGAGRHGVKGSGTRGGGGGEWWSEGGTTKGKRERDARRDCLLEGTCVARPGRAMRRR